MIARFCRAMEEASMRYLPVSALAGLTLIAGATGAQAGSWCAWFDAYTYNCGFNSFEQCRATVQGEGGLCSRNVYDAWAARDPAPEPGRKLRKQRRD
jgi:hypothetical protein